MDSFETGDHAPADTLLTGWALTGDAAATDKYVADVEENGEIEADEEEYNESEDGDGRIP